jgi:acyl-CoA synthetase (AMP-forming)/AMP-acid ligase II/acyl carrier protein
MTALFLMTEFGWERRNNAVVRRSDHFRRSFVEGEPDECSFEQATKLFVLENDNVLPLRRHLSEDFHDRVGRMELADDAPSLAENLANKSIDVFLIDNMFDTGQHYFRYVGEECPSFGFSFPINLSPRGVELMPSIQVRPVLEPEESADNWSSIVNWLRRTQPQAKIVFTCAPICTSDPGSDRYERSRLFPSLFAALSGDVDLLIPPVDVHRGLTKAPEDRDHFDLSVYRALAGHIYLSAISPTAERIRGNLNGLAGRADVNAALVNSETRSLLQVLSEELESGDGQLDERAGLGITPGWDSLKQVSLVAAVEKAFAVKLPFEAISTANNVAAFRQALSALGVTALDHPQQMEADRNSGPELLPSSHLFSTFVERARKTPDEEYLHFISGSSHRTFSHGYMLALAAAHAGAMAGLPSGGTVAIVLDHSEHIYASFIGATLIGLTPTILSPLTSRQDAALFQSSMAALFERLKPELVITSTAAKGSVPAGQRLLIVDDLKVLHRKEALPATFERARCGGETAFLQHSSGTTGAKKGVIISHDQALMQAEACSQALQMTANDKVASWLPLYHDMGLLSSFLIPTMIGAPIISMDAQEWVHRPGMLFEAIERYRATLAWLPNFAFHHMIRGTSSETRWDLSSLRMLVNCSEACRASTFDAFEAHFAATGITRAALGASYAMAENVFGVTQTRLGAPYGIGTGPASGYVSSGTPLEGVELQIVDSDDRAVSGGTVGEIWIKSEFLASGYLDFPELTERKFVDGWYRSGDLGTILSGELYVIGRQDDLIIVNGRNIVAHEIEDEISKIAGVAPGRVIALGHHDPEIGSSRLRVALETSGTVEEIKLKAEVLRIVYAQAGINLSAVVVVPRGFLVKSTSGKLSRAASEQKLVRNGLLGETDVLPHEDRPSGWIRRLLLGMRQR